MFLRYGKILEAWKQAKPRPQTDEEAARLVVATLKGHKKADVEVLIVFQSCKITKHFGKIIETVFVNDITQGLLSFYRLSSPGKLDEVSNESPVSVSEGLKFELQTLPVREFN